MVPPASFGRREARIQLTPEKSGASVRHPNLSGDCLGDGSDRRGHGRYRLVPGVGAVAIKGVTGNHC